MFCPVCEAEYKEGITSCPDCGVELVSELTPETKVHDTEQGTAVPLQSFKTSAEAEMVSELLLNNGIRSFVEGGDFAVIPGSFSQEVIVMVDERDLSKAVEIYEAYFDTDQPAPSSEDQIEG
jgi:Putative prokaryotic signal transducing protein